MDSRTPQQADAPSPRATAVATLVRAASSRGASPTSSRTPSPSLSRSTSTTTATAAAEALSARDRRRSRSIGAWARPFAASDDASLLPPPLPNAGGSASALERTASLLARQLAMAKLTGTTPPPAPATLLDVDEPLPTLAELQARARAKLAAAAAVPSPSASSPSPHLGPSALTRSGTLHAPPLPTHPGPLRRNNTVTGVGTASLSLATQAAHAGEARASPVNDARSEGTVGSDRAAARANLMRKLSARRLAGPSAATPRRPSKPATTLDVVGVIGRARPRSGSISALDWRLGGMEETPLVLGQGHDDGEVQETPKLAQASESGFDTVIGERTPRPASPGPADGDRQADGRSESAAEWNRAPSASSTSSSLSLSSTASASPSMSAGSTPDSIPGSVPSVTLHSRPRRNAPIRPTFGIPAVEFRADDEDDDEDDTEGLSEWAREARKRGSSASSSLTGALEAAARERSRGSDAAPLLAVSRGSASAGPPPAAMSRRRPSMPAGGAGPGADMVGLGVHGVPPVPLVKGPELNSQDPAAGLSGQGDHRSNGHGLNQSGEGKAKQKGFPPPEEGYQFPSPVGSPRVSQDLKSANRSATGESASQDPHQFFQQLSAKPDQGPLPSRKDRNFTLSLSNYQPFSSPSHLSASPVLPDPISPTSVIPDPMTALAFPRSHSPERASPVVPPMAHAMVKSPSTESGDSLSSSAAASSYHSPVSMRRDLSTLGNSSDIFPAAPRVPSLPASMHPSSRILAKLDSLLAASEATPAGQGPNPLDSPSRKLLLHAPVLQVVNANTVKDRHLFLFTDVLIIAKPIIEDHPLTGEPVPPTLDSHFVVKSIVECREVKLSAVEEPADDASPGSSSSKKRHPLLVAFVDRFANDPARAIAALVQKGGLSNDGPTIANLLFRNTDLNRNQLGAYLADPKHASVLRAYIERFRFAGVRIDDAVRLFVMSVRLPHLPDQANSVLQMLATVWVESNSASGFDPAVTASLIKSLLILSDTIHGHGEHDSERFCPLVQPGPPPSIDDFIAQFRRTDARSVVPEDLLTRVYTSVRRERIEQASDNSIFSMTPDIEATMVPAKLPTRLTYRKPSEIFTISIPEVDPHFTIKLQGTDLQFDPPVLSFARSKSQSFRVTGTALGVRVMVLIKRGSNAPRYQGLPLNKAFSVERGFMQHTFQVSFTNHLDVKRKYMFSCAFAGSRQQWLRLLRERISVSAHTPPAPPDPTLLAARTASLQALRDVLLPPDEPAPLVPPAAPSPRPNAAAPQRFGQPVAPPPPRTAGRLGTPTRAAQLLIRSNSVSKLYPAQFKHEADLGAASRARAANGASAAAAAGSRDELAGARTAHGRFLKTGRELVLTAEQNSLLPLLLSFLNGGLEAAPHPLSLQGSAFQLPPLDGNSAPFPMPSFIAPGTAL